VAPLGLGIVIVMPLVLYFVPGGLEFRQPNGQNAMQDYKIAHRMSFCKTKCGSVEYFFF
jgi:hypothetical protein